MAADRLFTGEAEKVWNELCRDDKVVVIADGLEEALTRGSVQTGVHSRGAAKCCQARAESGGSQGFPVMALLMASSAVMPWAAAVSR